MQCVPPPGATLMAKTCRKIFRFVRHVLSGEEAPILAVLKCKFTRIRRFIEWPSRLKFSQPILRTAVAEIARGIFWLANVTIGKLESLGSRFKTTQSAFKSISHLTSWKTYSTASTREDSSDYLQRQSSQAA